MRRLAALLIALTAWMLALGPAFASPCTLVAVDKPETAKVKVYFTKFIKEDNSGGKYKACKIVRTADKDSTTFFVTPFRQDATVVVHKSNWPG